MNLERYHLYASPDFAQFDFISEGPNGSIPKKVLLTPLEGNFFNLGFGDWDTTTSEIDDLVETNTGDMDKVLSMSPVQCWNLQSRIRLLSFMPKAVLPSGLGFTK